jgi:2',3'-cyclic-nucleotide 2'-phosphodiesterase (5'-nucleotidase family)
MLASAVRLQNLVWTCLTALAAAQTAVPAAAPGRVDVTLVHMNDFHGQFRPLEALWRESRSAGDEVQLVGGAAALAGYVRQVREAAATDGTRVVLTDAGDWFQGTLEGNSSKGSLAVAFLSRLQPDASVIGNHDYDFGAENLKRLIAAAAFPVLGANVLDGRAATRTPIGYVKPWQVVDAKGLRLVIVGLITADTKNVSTGPFGDAEFEREEKALTAVLPEARKAGDVVVLLTHCGLETDRRLAKTFPEIPLILGGHSHTALKTPLVVDHDTGGDTWIVQTQGKATSVQRIDARVDREQKKLRLLHAELVELDLATHPEDPATAAWIREQTKDLAATWDRVIGELATPLLDERGTLSTAAGNLLCDALIEATHADLAFSNKGGVRTRLRAGPLTPRHLYELQPFENTYVTLTLPGREVRALLAATLAPGRRLLDIGGGTYCYALVDGKRELRDVTVGGNPLDDARDYRVAVNSFLANGGDGYTTFANGRDRADSGVLMRDLLIAKVERDKRLVVDTRQRITVVDNR